ncbi:SA1362 family protein [Oceanobacillus manasiensis]|uniref:SA1362 family protein n=1 Tax=Oceanobacillus manasiensis TaxID=586413 RepID=UPI0005A97C35|nr:SA1362 family protein [Oceanobacillus manasiensis]
MLRNKISIFIYLIIGLAAIGLVSQLLTNTSGFITNLFVMIGMGIVFFGVIYFLFLRKRTSTDDMKKYKQAVKQSKAKYNDSRSVNQTNAKVTRTVGAPTRKKVSKRASHLRVIEGNKQKKNDRATF